MNTIKYGKSKSSSIKSSLTCKPNNDILIFNLNIMELQRDIFLPEYNQLMKDKDYIAMIEKCKSEIERNEKETFAVYTSIEWWHYIENQIYNEKNATVEKLSNALSILEDVKNIKSTWIKYLIEDLEKNIQDATDYISKKVWGMSWITMSIYTESDIKLEWNFIYKHILSFYENLKNSLKKEWEDESTLTEVKES